MSFETVEGTLNIICTMVMTTALAAILLLIGFWIRKKVSFLTKYCIPAPVVGGFLFMFMPDIRAARSRSSSTRPSRVRSWWRSSPPSAWERPFPF